MAKAVLLLDPASCMLRQAAWLFHVAAEEILAFEFKLEVGLWKLSESFGFWSEMIIFLQFLRQHKFWVDFFVGLNLVNII